MKTIQKYFTLIVLSCLMASIVSCKPSDELKTLQANYIPSAISDVYIGMSMKDFKDTRGMQNLSLTKKGDATIFKEEYTKDSITLFQYHFNKKKKLSKLIIEYSSDYVVYDVFKAKNGEPNSGKAWLIVLDKKLSLLIWSQQNALIIANNKQFKN